MQNKKIMKMAEIKEKKDSEKTTKSKDTKKEIQEYAIIQVRGTINTNPEIKDTLKMLNLKAQNNCVIVQLTPSYKGMMQKVKDFASFGPINKETKEMLIKKYGEQKTYRLSPPKKGYERKGIKKPFKIGGALGNRGEKINDLIKRMLQ